MTNDDLRRLVKDELVGDRVTQPSYSDANK